MIVDVANRVGRIRPLSKSSLTLTIYPNMHKNLNYISFYSLLKYKVYVISNIYYQIYSKDIYRNIFKGSNKIMSKVLGIIYLV